MTAFLISLTNWLPPGLRAQATEARIRVLVQFAMFGTVGLIGFAADTATVYALWGALGLYVAGLAGYLSGATTTWFFNRAWTFRGQESRDAWYMQWSRFLAANLPGFAINRGIYAALITFVDAAAHYPIIAVFAGALAGLTLNFNLSRKMVFR